MAEPLDCKSEEGITIGLIDIIMTSAVLLRGRSFNHPDVANALVDLAYDKDVNSLLGRANDARADYEEDQRR